MFTDTYDIFTLWYAYHNVYLIRITEVQRFDLHRCYVTKSNRDYTYMPKKRISNRTTVRNIDFRLAPLRAQFDDIVAWIADN